MIVFLLIDAFVNATAFLAYETVFIFGINDVIDGIVFSGESFGKLKLSHNFALLLTTMQRYN